MGKISGLPLDTAPTTDDYFPVVDATTGILKRVLLGDLATLMFNNKPTVNLQSTTLTPANFNTTSTSYVDYTGLSVAITTSANTSGKVLLILTSDWFDITGSSNLGYLALCDSANNVLKSMVKGGVGTGNFGVGQPIVHIVTGLSASTAYTFKARVKVSAGTLTAGTSVVTGDSIQALEL